MIPCPDCSDGQLNLENVYGTERYVCDRCNSDFKEIAIDAGWAYE